MCWRGPSLHVWTFTCADSPAHRSAARRHGGHVLNTYLARSNHVPSGLCGFIVVVGAGGYGVVAVAAAAVAVVMELV